MKSPTVKDLQKAVDETELKLKCKRLETALSEAWEIGADHRMPTFQTLNDWRELINNE